MRLNPLHCMVALAAVASLSLIAPSDGKLYLVKAKNNTKSCKIYRRPALHDLMDRVCLMCHEMFSHERPNMRSECRSNCFKSLHFKQCLKMFMASGSAPSMPNLIEDEAEE